MALDLVTCPICGAEQPALSHYPGYLCRDCVARASTEDGRRLRLVNTDPGGTGFAARYADDDELCEEATITHVVHVDGVRCRADEGRVGGIVVQPEPDDAGRG
jgi:hypothetical protein